MAENIQKGSITAPAHGKSLCYAYHADFTCMQSASVVDSGVLPPRFQKKQCIKLHEAKGKVEIPGSWKIHKCGTSEDTHKKGTKLA